jgi:hypothetical protein
VLALRAEACRFSWIRRSQVRLLPASARKGHAVAQR